MMPVQKTGSDKKYVYTLAKLIGLPFAKFNTMFSYIDPEQKFVRLRWDMSRYTIEFDKSSKFNRFVVTIYPTSIIGSNCEIKMDYSRNTLKKVLLAHKIKQVLFGVTAMTEYGK